MFHDWPSSARGRGGSTHAGSVDETLEIAVDERAPLGEKRRQPLELRDADARIDVGQIELAAGKCDVARAVGLPLDAVEAQHFDSPRLVHVVADDRAALDRRHVLVRMKAERDEIADRADGASLPARARCTSAASSMTRSL